MGRLVYEDCVKRGWEVCGRCREIIERGQGFIGILDFDSGREIKIRPQMAKLDNKEFHGFIHIVGLGNVKICDLK